MQSSIIFGAMLFQQTALPYLSLPFLPSPINPSLERFKMNGKKIVVGMKWLRYIAIEEF